MFHNSKTYRNTMFKKDSRCLAGGSAGVAPFDVAIQ